MQEDFLAIINDRYDRLTKTEKKVADFVLKCPRKVLFMSIMDLSECCGVSDTSEMCIRDRDEGVTAIDKVGSSGYGDMSFIHTFFNDGVW